GAWGAVVRPGELVLHAGAGIWAGVDDVPGAAGSHGLLLYRYAMADWNHSFGELHIFELSGAGAGLSAPGRQASGTIRSRALEEERGSRGIRWKRQPSKRTTRRA